MNPADRITRARIQLITGIDNHKPDEEKRAASFLGTLALGLRVRDASGMVFWNGICETMGTDGRNLFYNPEFVKSITDDVLLGVVAHEIMHCFKPDTPILTSKGLVPIADVKVGDKVYGKGNFTEVVKIGHREYKGKIIKITPKYGDSVWVTPEHPILSLRYDHKKYLGGPKSIAKQKEPLTGLDFRDAGDLTEQDCLALYLPQKTEASKGKCFIGRVRKNYTVHRLWLDEDLAYFCGWFVADGNLAMGGKKGSWFGNKASKCQVVFTLHTNNDETRLIEIIKNKIFRSPCIVKIKGVNAKRVIFSGKTVARFLQENFYDENGIKCIPAWFLDMPINIIKSFMQGFVEGDGHTARNGQTSVSSSYPGVQGMLPLLLLKMGQRPSFHAAKNEKQSAGFPNAKPAKRITWSEERERSHSVFIDDTWIIPIRSIETEYYEGKVYNFETVAHVYTVPLFTVHNCVYQHVLAWRRPNTKQYPELFTMAQEYVVNDAVVNMFKLKLPEKVFLDKDYFGMFTEQVYHELLKKYPPKEQGGLGSMLKEGMVDQHGLSQPSEGSGGQQGKEGGGDGLTGKALEAELEVLSQDLKLKVAQAANAVRMRGTLPAGLERIIDEILEPRLPWRVILAEFLCSNMAKDDYSWRIPNRRHIHRNIILPALRSETIELAVIFDTSGSISKEELTEAWQETRGIMGAFTSYTIHLMGCDTKVTDIQSVGPWDEPDLEKLFVGRGGTDFVAPFVKLKEEGVKPRAVVYFTADACGSFPDEEPGYPVLWVVKGGAMEVPWGRRVELD